MIGPVDWPVWWAKLLLTLAAWATAYFTVWAACFRTQTGRWPWEDPT